ncbi:MAG: hypothetical protein ACI9ON_004073, partial [Limisphaerales bacterium]
MRTIYEVKSLPYKAVVAARQHIPRGMHTVTFYTLAPLSLWVDNNREVIPIVKVAPIYLADAQGVFDEAALMAVPKFK